MRRNCRVVIVDDSPALLEAATRLAQSIEGVEVVGAESSGAGALSAVDRLRPDIVLMDLSLPGMDGLEATRRLLARPEPPAVLMMSVHDLPQYRDAALAAGARLFVPKSDLSGSLRIAVQGLCPWIIDGELEAKE